MVDEPSAVRSGRRAAQYLRMSTDHQRYSLANQAAAVSQYAEDRGYEIVATYTDRGISGVDIKRRKGLKRLLADVLAGDCGFDTILVYDVSRWGRFQNPDQSAHYEFICTEAGVQVEYCAEAFANDGSLSSTLLKALKRVMAAEFSRELSAKIYSSKTTILHNGFWAGGSAGYGLRRQMIAPDGKPGPIMERGEFKAIQSHRTILVPGPPHEVAIVQRIYRMFVDANMSRPKIARILNAEGVLSHRGGTWTEHTVNCVLTNPKYLGELVGNRTSSFLHAQRQRRSESQWVRKPGAFQPIVSRNLFAAAQAKAADRSIVHMTREEMVEALRTIYTRHGKITVDLINANPKIPSTSKFHREFGGSPGLYHAIGAPQPRSPSRKQVVLTREEILHRLRGLLDRCGYLNAALINADPGLPSSSTIGRAFGDLNQAYLLVGFVPLSYNARSSLVGRARVAAARAVARRTFPEADCGTPADT